MGVTVAGGNGQGCSINQLNKPYGLCIIDDNMETLIVVADFDNDRIVQWKIGDSTNGEIIAGGNGRGTRLDQLDRPTDVLYDKDTDSLIIADRFNRRVVRWPRHSKNLRQGEALVDNIGCFGLFLDNQRNLYVSDVDIHEIRRYQMNDIINDKRGTVVAGGNNKGAGFNQLSFPAFMFVDQQQNIYVSDADNCRVMKWCKNAPEGIVVAGGHGKGDALNQLHIPMSVFVDTSGVVYASDSGNGRIVRWNPGSQEGVVVLGGNGRGNGANQFFRIAGISVDRHGNLYLVDNYNERVQQFTLE